MVADCGIIAGAGRSGDAAQQGISVLGNGTTIRRCTLARIGYNGIHFSGSHVVIEENSVDSFCLVKDDGAGIYNFESEGQKVTNRTIRKNTVLHAVGAFAGAESYYYEGYGKAAGIYLDGDSHQTDVTENVIGYGPWAGFFVNNNGNNRFTDNLVYGHKMAILLSQSKNGRIRDMVITGNRLIGKKPLYLKLYEADKPEQFGRFSKNIYSKGEGVWIDGQFTGGRTEKIEFKSWQALGLDKDSEIRNR
jgi:parallel beta-helix repeat protein